MRIRLENIGKVKRADIELAGITVIGGENNTGKSTIGKALFAFFNAFYNKQEKIQKEYEKILEGLLISYMRQNPHNGSGVFHQEEFLSKNITKITHDFLKTKETTNTGTQSIEDFLDNLSQNFQLNSTNFNELKQQLLAILAIDDSEIITRIFQDILNREFNNQINNIYHEEKGTITIKIKDTTIAVVIDRNRVTTAQVPFNIHTEVIYIENPFVLDSLNNRQNLNGMDHSVQLLNKLQIKQDDGIIQEILTDKKLSRIFEKMNTVCSGSMISEDGEFKYKTAKNAAESLDIRNLSTGLKAFVIIKKLLQNGSLKEKSLLILDEPEIHLHPEWQLVFAEIIVLLQKEFSMHILINTHSPYFLEAIEVYTKKHNISKYNYYLANSLSEFEYEIKEITGNTELIYQKLSQPFQKLEDEDNGDD